MEPRFRVIWMWLALLFIASLVSCDPAAATDSEKIVKDEESSSSDSSNLSVENDERERRQVYHGRPVNFQLGQSVVSGYPSQTPSAHRTQHQGYQTPRTYHLTQPSTTGQTYKSKGRKSSSKSTISKGRLAHKTTLQFSTSDPGTSSAFPFGRPEFTPAQSHYNPHGHQPSSMSYGTGPTRPGYGSPPLGECPPNHQCLPLVWCAPCYNEIKDNNELGCPIYGGAAGVCCPQQNNDDRIRRVFSEPIVNVSPLYYEPDVVDQAARAALWQLEERDKLEYALRERFISIIDTRSPEYGHLSFFKTNPRAVAIARNGLTNAGAGDYLVTRFRLSALDAAYGLQSISLRDTLISNTCPVRPVCREKDQFYRTIDGSCNNLDNPEFGQARTPFTRLLPPQYSDGLLRPRESRTGGPLPSARVVSLSAVTDVDNPDPDLTLFVMQWGQFIDHDLTQSPIFRFDNDSGIECCQNNRREFIDSSFFHPSCFPIEIPADDPFFGRSGRRCMNFVRSMIAPTSRCTLGFAEQMNQLTHHLDGSNIYGSSREEEELLRAGRGGLLNVQQNNLLPPDPEAEECESIREGLPCFRAGDNRVNEQVQLSVIHTLWVRFHNIIASTLARQNPRWSDETLYQEARRIVVAMYQHIVYNEWLPLIIGKEYMAEMRILPLRQGFSTDYDSSVNPTIANEFATAAFRFGHTLVQGMLDLLGKKGRGSEQIELHTQFNNPRLIYTPGKLDQFLRGLYTQPSQQVDNFVSAELTNRLFETEEMPFGMDLVALNVQRGRDHAIAPYNDLRQVCGLPRAETFRDLLDVLPEEVVAAFERIYATVDDIDPFVAGISERHAPGSILGPTFRCIVADQFTRLKRGDRFFYDLGGMPTSFSEAQLNEIRKVSWARILCLTGDNIMYVQPLALLQPRGLNERVMCDSPAIPQLDLSLWTSRLRK